MLGCLVTGTVMRKRKLKDLLFCIFFKFVVSILDHMREVPKFELIILLF
jgi:hypothetical protein